MCKYDPINVLRIGGVQEFEEMLRWKEVKWKTADINRVKDSIRRLEEKKYILTKKEGERLFVKLLDDGVEEALKKTIIEKHKRLPKGKYCYVSFDIPEASRRARLALRLLLKRADFQMIHQSLWYTPRDVARELSMLISVFKIRPWVYIIQGNAITTSYKKLSTNIDRKLKKKKEKLEVLKKERKQARRIASNLSMQ